MDARDLWSVPVPVRRSTFVARDPAHEALNVEVDLAAIEAFGLRGRAAHGELLYSDLQSNADGNVNRRLGSGRAGFYRGAYLKGLGRTTLAGNWLDDDQYHATGHMQASAAARERLISRYVVAGGAGATINPCEGVLVRALPDPDLDFLRGLLGPDHPPFAVDLRLQAISIKPGGFARLSNFLWAIDHHGVEPTWLVDYLGALAAALGPVGAPAPTAAELDPEAIAGRFAAAFERGLASFDAYRRLGVLWGSFHNNVTADGRFLDLEVPTVLGGPALGKPVPRGVDPRRARWTGLDAGKYVTQFRAFLAAFRARLALLAEYGFTGGAAEFLRELDRALATAFPPGHLVFDRAALAAYLVDSVAQALELAAGPRRIVARIADGFVHRDGELDDATWAEVDLVPVGPIFAPAEPGPLRQLHVPRALLDATRIDPTRIETFAAAVRGCDQASTTDGYLAALGRGEESIDALFH